MNPSRLVKTLKSAPSEIVIASKLFLRTFDRLVFTLKFSSTSERFQELCLRLFGFDYFPFYCGILLATSYNYNGFKGLVG